ncbi:hypothetical protein [Methylorubrum extorquens]|uniref:hypothetical protein n=1 Tax=Methylorubrum extorquens TaxID=408 RepID=UPI001EE530CC|nr:hypothetical protein [Methylorubrum extorquens]MCG5249626.1 hypothetical protein [Methylorubrum extorquens]
MFERSQIVSMILKAARQIAAHEKFAEEAMWCAEMVDGGRNEQAATALRAMVVTRQTEIAEMREVMAQLAIALAGLPLETV